MKDLRILFLIIPSLAGVVFIASSTTFIGKEKGRVVLPDLATLHSGDIIFRHGRGMISEFFAALSQHDHRYSHAGIIHKEKGQYFVYHTIGEDNLLNNKIRKDKLENFCNSLTASSYGIYRTSANGDLIDDAANEIFDKGVRFDTDFDLSTDQKMYCTEFVYKAICKATGEQTIPLTQKGKYTYVACDNIYLLPSVKEVFTYNY